MFGILSNKKKDWIKITSKDESFEIMFPSKTKKQHAGFFADDNKSTGTNIYTSNKNSSFYQLSVTRLMTPYRGSANEFLETALNTFIVDIHEGKLIKSNFRQFKKFPTLDFAISTTNNMRGKGMIISNGNLLYCLCYIFTNENQKDYQRFINSFKII